MSKYYVGDEPLIDIDCVNDISAASEVKIRYERSDGTFGYWVGNPSGTTHITYQCVATDLNLAGTWKFQAYVLVSGRPYHGDTVSQLISALGN